MGSEIISTDKVSKSFGDVKAVSEVSLSVRKGEIYGFLGLNGAGKTTTIRMLLGMIRPDYGSIIIRGQRVSAGRTDLWNHVGSLVEIPYSYPELTVRENLEIFRRLRKIKDPKCVDSIIEKLGLSSYADRKAKNLSLGNNQRLGLAKALIHDPDILILDEPGNGLDPAGIYEIRALLINLAENRGVTVFISSHILGEISRFANRIGIIHEGVLVQELDASDLESLSRKKLLIGTRDQMKAQTILSQKGFTAGLNEENYLWIRNDEAVEHPDDIAVLLVNSGCPPTLLKVEEEDLETYFLRTIGMEGGRK